jgi:hypothetical protein
MRRRSPSFDQQLSGSRALQAIEFVRIDNHQRITSMQRDVLRSIPVCHAHKLAESRFRATLIKSF